MRIDEEDRVPLPHCLDASARFGMNAEDPVAVEIEHVMIGASGRPITGVEEGLVVDVGDVAPVLADHLEEAVAAVGVHHRIDDDQEVVQHVADLIIARGDEVVCDRDGGIGAGSLVAVDRIREPRDRRR